MPQPPDLRQRLRITFSQDERIKYVGHLDMARTWERALRRADLPVSYTQGFNPQLRIMFASALPVGFTGLREVVDLILDQAMDTAEFRQRLAAQLPPAIQIVDVHEVSLREPALQATLRAAEYRVGVQSELSAEAVEQRLRVFLAAPEVRRERKRKGQLVSYDLRPLVEELRYTSFYPAPFRGGGCSLLAEGRWHWLWMRLHSEPGLTGRPDEVLMALGLEPLGARIERQRLIFAQPGSGGHVNHAEQSLTVGEADAESQNDALAAIACS